MSFWISNKEKHTLTLLLSLCLLPENYSVGASMISSKMSNDALSREGKSICGPHIHFHFSGSTFDRGDRTEGQNLDRSPISHWETDQFLQNLPSPLGLRGDNANHLPSGCPPPLFWVLLQNCSTSVPLSLWSKQHIPFPISLFVFQWAVGIGPVFPNSPAFYRIILSHNGVS